MLPSEYNWGYCRNCVKNVPYVEWHTSSLFQFLDNMTFGKLRMLRIGPWHCVHCQSQSIVLRRTQADAVDYPIQDLESSGSHQNQDVAPGHAESVGNFIRTDESLVMRSNRLKRFSEKYRDAVVRRILKGSTTMAQVRQEMDVSETELVDWIADIFDRQQAKLDALGSVADAFPALRIVDDNSPSDSPEDSNPGSVTVDGRVRPK